MLVTWVLAIAAVVAALFLGRGVLSWGARKMAALEMSAGAIRGAQQWLAWSSWLDSSNGETELMQAACARHLEDVERWREAITSAERKGAPATRMQQEIMLGEIRSGEVHGQSEDPLGALLDAGVPPHEVCAAFVHGYLLRGEPDKAKMVLDAWSADMPDDAHLGYMKGVYWRHLSELGRARTEFENTLARQPRHQLARAALAELLETDDRLEEAFAQYVALATRSSANETTKVALGRILRKSGRLAEARAVLESFASRAEPRSDVVLEMAQIEFESGNYQEAQSWFRRVDLDRTRDLKALASAAGAFGLDGKTAQAERYLALLNAATNRKVRGYDLRARLAVDPNDGEAASELHRLSLPPTAQPVSQGVSGSGQKEEDREEASGPSGPELYALHCSACHGTNGDGNGRAARYLFPRPRDLRIGKSRLVSTDNGVPTLGDLEAVLRRGMPGTSMPAFDNLSEDQHRLLARELVRLNREGIREHFINALQSEGEEVEEDDVRQVVDLCTTPGEIVPVPEVGPASPEAIARGRDAYLRLGCDNCHGDDGTGPSDTPLFDEKGRPSPPRDLVYESFKGGQAAESVYLRVYLGMPGTAHPACSNVPEAQLIDLVHHCRSLSREPKRVQTNHQRTARAYLTATGKSPPRLASGLISQ